LAILLLIGVGVLLKQSHYDIGRFGTDPNAAGVVEAQNNSKLKTQNSKLRKALDPLAPQGFGTLSEIEVYEPDNLYEKINGKAPLYIESDFVKLFTQRFISKDDETLWMELFVYDMATIKNAFSVYGVQKRADVELLPSMQFGYRTSEAPYFVHGKYYIEFIGSSESAELFERMVEVAQNIRTNLAIDIDTEIAELSLFPQENLVPGSSKLYLKSAFGFEGFTDVFAARYKLGDETVTAFLSRRSDLQDAQLLAESYYNFLIENDAVAKPTANKTLRGVRAKVLDFYGTTEIIFAVGPFIGGVHEAENQEYAEKLAVVLANKLSQAAEAMGND